MKISIIGLGYIGLPTAAVFASKNIQVIGIDIDPKIVDTINRGNIHIIEPNLQKMVRSGVKKGFLRATTKIEPADVFIICVPTPLDSDHNADLSYVENASIMISSVLTKNNLVILESTSPVKTTEKVINWMKAKRMDLSFPIFGASGNFDINCAYCPERVLPGNIIHELVNNDRIIGGVSQECAPKASDIYNILIEAECFITDSRTAELSKLVENSYRDVNIAFANELSIICDKFDINVWSLIELANRHPRVEILQPGPGVGGHCIAIDPWFIVNSVPNDANLIRTAREVNDSKPSFVLNKLHQIIEEIGADISELSIACLGLSFKADIDDLRESPALEIVSSVSLMNFNKIYLVEPNINKIPKEFVNENIELVELKLALKSSEIVLLLVDHSPFKLIDLGLLSDKKLLDTRGIWS